MPSSEVQRTLVKSPPELWAELSDPASLTKHLGEFGEIRTTRVEPETVVEWEAGDVRGAVQLKPSGWGTKVTLTVTREPPADTSSEASEPQPVAESLPTAEPVHELTPAAEPVPAADAPPAAESTPEADPEPLPELTPAPAAEPEPEELELPPAASAEEQPETQAAQRRPGFFARIFRRRRGSRATELELAQPPESEAWDAPERQDEEISDELARPDEAATGELALGQAQVATGEEPVLVEASQPPPEPASAPVPAPAPASASAPAPAPAPAEPTERPDLAAELAQVEQAMLEQDTALLTAVLDRLGAAHHRPFSRG
jgi:hypothetical protein